MAMPPAIPHMLLPLKCQMQHKIGTAATTYYHLRCHKVQRSARRNNILAQRQMIPLHGATKGQCTPQQHKRARALGARKQPTLALALLNARRNSRMGPALHESTCRERLLPLVLPDAAQYRHSGDKPRSTPAQRCPHVSVRAHDGAAATPYPSIGAAQLQ